MEFPRESSAHLRRLAEHMRTLTDKDEFSFYSNKYAYLLELQMEAIGCTDDQTAEELKRRFLQEYAACNPILAISTQNPADEDVRVPPSQEQKEEIKKIIHAWCQLDNEERELKARIQAMRKIFNDKNALKNQLTESIMTFMEFFNYEELETKNGFLRFNKREVKKAVSKNRIMDRIKQYVDRDGAAVDDLITNVFEPELVTRRSLRRLLPN